MTITARTEKDEEGSAKKRLFDLGSVACLVAIHQFRVWVSAHSLQRSHWHLTLENVGRGGSRTCTARGDFNSLTKRVLCLRIGHVAVC
jgi:hypothetical protein